MTASGRTPALTQSAVRDFIAAARVAHLATSDLKGAPHAIPICFWFDGARLYFVIDEKPKRLTGTGLKRMRNIAQNPQVVLLIDHYEENWAHLAYILIHGLGSVVEDPEEYMLALRGLRDKYPQYRAMALSDQRNPMVRVDPERVHLWGARFGATPSA